MDICFSNNAANTNTQHKVLKVQLYMLIFVQVCSTIDKIYKSKNKVLVLEEQLRAKESPRELGCKSESEDIRVWRTLEADCQSLKPLESEDHQSLEWRTWS